MNEESNSNTKLLGTPKSSRSTSSRKALISVSKSESPPSESNPPSFSSRRKSVNSPGTLKGSSAKKFTLVSTTSNESLRSMISPSSRNLLENFGAYNATFSDALEKLNNSEISNFNLEDFRLKVKKFITNSLPGVIYSNVMLVISIISSIEYIYQTYLDPQVDVTIFSYLTVIEKCMAGLFMADWLLNFFIADHKIIFMTRLL